MILPLCYADYMTPVSAETVQRLVTTTTSQVQVHWNPEVIHKKPATMESNLIQVASSMSFQSVSEMYETGLGIGDAIIVEPYKEGRTVSMSF